MTDVAIVPVPSAGSAASGNASGCIGASFEVMLMASN